MSQEAYTYVLVRSDLRIEQQMVQAAHAALEAGFAFKAPPSTSNLVLLAVAGQDELLAAAEMLADKGVEHELFFEPDDEMGYSALATRPLFTKRERSALAGFALVRGPGTCAKPAPALQN
jgi:hypothetical protein